MAHLSDDDVPTMTGVPGSLDGPDDSGDTTSADLSVPVAAAVHAASDAAAAKAAEESDDDEVAAGHDAEDRTVQQKVTSPSLARPARRDAPAPLTTGPSTLLSASSSAPASSGPAATGPPTHSPALGPISAPAPTSSSPLVSSVPSTDPAPAAIPIPTGVDEDELEDSVTATAPRIPPSKLNIAIPGAVEIRTVDHDELLDETEVKTMANLTPDLQRAIKNARLEARSHNAPQPSQPPPPPRPAAGAPPPVSMPAVTKPSRDKELASTSPSPHAQALAATMNATATELDPDELSPDSSEDVHPADEEGATAQSLAPRVGSMPDTEVGPPSGVAGTPKDLPRSSQASLAEPETSKTGADAAIAAAIAAAEAEEPATSPGVGEGDSAATDDPPTRPGLVEPATSPGIGDPPTNPRPGDPPTHPRSESAPKSKRVEARPPAGSETDVETENDDSITTQAPKLPADLIAAAVAKATGGPFAIDDDDSTDGTTLRVKRAKPLPAAGMPPEPSPADEEAESITTQAPGPLTNMLRVIAADRTSTSDDPPIEEDEPEENRTAVMANAPLIRAADQHARSNGLSVPTQMGIGPRAVAAPQLNPTSESGLRVARPGSGSGERMSVGAMNAADNRASGIARAAMPGDAAPHGLGHANTELAFPPGATPQPSVHDVDLGKGPRYGLLVGIVAFVSLVVPVTLFLVLRGNDAPATPGTPNEAATDFQKHDGPRTKLEKGKKPPPEQPSATPSGSASSKPPGKGPFGRGR